MKRLILALLALFHCLPSLAAIAPDANGVDSGTNATPTLSHTATGSDRYAHICIYANADTTISAISYGAQTPTLIQRFNIGFGSSNTLWVFGLIAPNTGAQTVSATLAGGSSLWGITVSSYTGVHQTTATGTPVTAEFNGATPVTVDATSATGEVVVDCMIAGAASATVGAGQTARYNGNDAGDMGFRAFGTSDEAGATTTTMSWALTSASGRSGTIAVPLKPSAGGGGGNLLLLRRRD